MLRLARVFFSDKASAQNSHACHSSTVGTVERFDKGEEKQTDGTRNSGDSRFLRSFLSFFRTRSSKLFLHRRWLVTLKEEIYGSLRHEEL